MIVKHFKLSQPEKDRLIRIKAKQAFRTGMSCAAGRCVGHWLSLLFQGASIRCLTAMLKWIGLLLPVSILKFMKQSSGSVASTMALVMTKKLSQNISDCI